MKDDVVRIHSIVRPLMGYGLRIEIKNESLIENNFNVICSIAKCGGISCNSCSYKDIDNYRKWQKQQKENGGG